MLLAKIADRFRVLPITPEIVQVALALELPHGDPFDRSITATATAHKIPLLTRDRLIVGPGVVETIWNFGRLNFGETAHFYFPPQDFAKNPPYGQKNLARPGGSW